MTKGTSLLNSERVPKRRPRRASPWSSSASHANESEPMATKRAAVRELPRPRPLGSKRACHGSKRNSWLFPVTNQGLPSLPGSRLGRALAGATAGASSLTVPSLAIQ